MKRNTNIEITHNNITRSMSSKSIFYPYLSFCFFSSCLYALSLSSFVCSGYPNFLSFRWIRWCLSLILKNWIRNSVSFSLKIFCPLCGGVFFHVYVSLPRSLRRSFLVLFCAFCVLSPLWAFCLLLLSGNSLLQNVLVFRICNSFLLPLVDFWWIFDRTSRTFFSLRLFFFRPVQNHWIRW